MSNPQRLYSVRLFLSKQGTFTRIFDVIYEETPDPAFTGTGVSQLMTFFTAPFRSQYMKTPKRGKKEIDLLPTI